MNNLGEYVKKHPFVVVGIIVGVVVLYLLYKAFSKGSSGTTQAAQQPVTSVPAAAAVPSTYAPVTSTTSSYSDVYAPTTTTTENSTYVGPVSTNTNTNTTSTSTTTTTTNYNQPALSSVPAGFTGVAGTSQNPIPVSGYSSISPYPVGVPTNGTNLQQGINGAQSTAVGTPGQNYSGLPPAGAVPGVPIFYQGEWYQNGITPPQNNVPLFVPN